MTNGETLLLKILMYLPKVLFATIGGIISLIFSDDIDAGHFNQKTNLYIASKLASFILAKKWY